ncbi:MAG TPA: PhnA-like protein [Alphaproteobacteria bacterium]|nr:PhnA-like protein [Alphaproteobacteria bacterium]
MARPTLSGSGEYVTTAPVASPAVVESLRRVSWGAVFGGVVISLITQFLLSMLGVGIGVSTVDPATGDTPAASTFSISAAIWWTVSGIISAFFGGWIAARLSGALAASAALHGLVTWATTMLLVLYLLTTAAGALIGGAFGFLGTTLSGMGETVRAVAPQLANAAQGPLGDLRQEVEGTLQNASPADKARAASTMFRAITTRDLPQAERDQAADALAQHAGIPQQDARDRLDRWRDTYQRSIAETEARARSTAETTARAVSRAAIFGFVALVLGAIAGALGGRAGAPQRTVVATTD